MMASYLRETERADALPAIRRTQAWETVTPSGSRRVVVDQDPLLLDRDRNVRIHTTTTAYRDDPLLVPRPPSPGLRDQQRRHMADMQDQVSFYKDEIAKKDRLIAQLSSMPDTPRASLKDSTAMIEEIYAADRITESAALKSEGAALRVKVDGLQSQLRELQAQLDMRDEKIRTLKLHLESARENEAKQVAIIQSLRQQVIEYEAQYGSIEGAANRSELTISSLQRDNKALQERILELESRTRDALAEKDAAVMDNESIRRHVVDVLTKICTLLNLDLSFTWSLGSIDTLSAISTKVGDLVHDNVTLRGKIESMRDHMCGAEAEHKVSRETIMRLVGEAEREQKITSKLTVEMDALRLERDQARAKVDDLMREADLLKDRLEVTQRSWDAAQRELKQKETHYIDIDVRLRDYELAVRNAETAFKSFKQSVAHLLSDSITTVDCFEETIRERIEKLMMAVRDKSAHIDILESKVRDLTAQLDAQCDLHRSADSKARHMELEFRGLEDRLQRAESEMAAGEALRDGFRVDKDRYMRFLESISRILKMDVITADMGIDSCTDAILARAEQLVKLEFEALNDRKTHIYNLQRKVKSQKEQLDSKDLHMELLRKKVAALEERLAGKSELEREKDEDYVKNRKLMKLVEKYKVELNEARLEIRDLKARLLETSEIRNVAMVQEQALESLEAKVGQLEHVREKQAKKIGALRDSVHVSESKLGEKHAATNNTIHALSSELRTTKSALEEVTKRERQLLDLRAVVSRMLGLDVNTLAVPDYEIIARLEKLIMANQANASTAIALDTALEDMQDGFRAGYEDATRAISANAAAKARYGKAARAQSRTRSRSLSPARKRDPRAY